MLKNFFSLLLILNVAATYGQTSVPQWQWAQAAKGLGHEFAYEVDVDAKGNSVFCGEFQTPSCQFGSTTLQAPLTYNYNFFIARVSAGGQFLWAKSGQSVNGSRATGISCDANGNSRVVGEFYGSDSLDFGSVKIPLNLGASTNVFIADYDSNGQVKWARNLGAGRSVGNNVAKVALDQWGHAFVAADFDDSTYLVKLNAGGQEIWRASYSNSPTFQQMDIGGVATDSAGNVFVAACSFASSITLGTQSITNLSGGKLLVLVKLDSAGNVLWCKFDGGYPSIYAPDISTDLAGNAVVTGYFGGTIAQFGSVQLNNLSGFEDLFLVKYSPQGNVLWAKRAGGVWADLGYSVDCDTSGSIYVGGMFRGTAVFDNVSLSANNAPEIFVAKYNPSGTAQWAIKAGEMDVDILHGLACSPKGDVWACGNTFSDTCRFGSSIKFANSSPPPYSSESWVARLQETLVNATPTDQFTGYYKVYPNPSRNGLMVDHAMHQPLWTVTDITGKVCLQGQHKYGSPTQFEINISELRPGNYYLHLQDAATFKTAKVSFLKQE